MKDADTFGLSVLGNGVTIKKKHHFNVLASALNILSTFLVVVDRSRYLAGGGEKDVEYIATMFLPHMEELDHSHSHIDLFIVNGASNVQKAGRVVTAVFPWVLFFMEQNIVVLSDIENC